MNGKRVEDYVAPHLLQPGQYSKVPFQRENAWWPGHSYWHVCTPNGLAGSLVTHKVVEHEDGTITVSPSILCDRKEEARTEKNYWHGYLECGVWKEC